MPRADGSPRRSDPLPDFPQTPGEPEELAGAHAALLVNLSLAFETTDSTLDALARARASGLTPADLAAMRDASSAVTAAEVRTLASAMLEPRHLVMVLTSHPDALDGVDALGLGKPVMWR